MSINEEYLVSLEPSAAREVREDTELVEGMVEAIRLIERRFGGEKCADAAKRELVGLLDHVLPDWQLSYGGEPTFRVRAVGGLGLSDRGALLTTPLADDMYRRD